MPDNFYGGLDFGTSGARISIIKEFNLRNLPKKMGGKFFRKTASYGHFGRRDLELPWENVEEKAAQLAEASKIF